VLTPKGRALEEVIGKEMQELNDRALAGVTRGQRRTLIRALEAIQKNLADRG
jgi:DNA-binding MarR family transcriptional regulator